MRDNTLKSARIILDISYLLSLTQEANSKEKFSTNQAQNLIESIIAALSKINIYLNEIELILLTQSNYNKEEKFLKIIAGQYSEFITYQKLKELIGLDNEVSYFWRNAKKIPAITVDNKKLTGTLDINTLSHLDTPENQPPTFMLLSPETQTLGELPPHFHSTNSHFVGSFPQEEQKKILALLEFHSYEKIVVYTDFDQTLCNNKLFQYTKNLDDRMNPALAKIFKKIRSMGSDVDFRLLTSRPPLHQAIAYYFKKVGEFFNQLENKGIQHDSTLKIQAKNSLTETQNLVSSKLKIADETQKLKEILLKYPDPDQATTSFKASIPEELKEEEKKLFLDQIKLMENKHIDVSTTVKFLCIADVPKQYLEKHGIFIETRNDCHLFSAQTNRFKADYICQTHQHDENKTLVILIDDSFIEIADLNRKTQKSEQKKPKLYDKVDAIGIKIARDNELCDHGIQKFHAFFDQVVAEAEERKKPDARLSKNSGLFGQKESSDEESTFNPTKTPGSHGK